MEMDNIFLYVGGDVLPVKSGGSKLGGWTELIGVAVDFGISYLTSKEEGRKNEELLQRIAELDSQSAEKLKKAINATITNSAKTQVILEFINAKKIKELEAETKKKRILPLIGLGVGVVVLALILYKLHKQNG